MKEKKLTEEIQELIQQIETNYQEGIDYKHNTWDEIHKNGVGITSILSPRLKKYCREKFSFPLGINDYLDYWKNDVSGSAVLYRANRTIKSGEVKGGDCIWWCKERLDAQKLDQNPKKCSVCQKKLYKKDGRMKLWDDECRDIGVNEDGWSRKVSRPSPLAYFHPECSQKYFANKEQSNKNDNSRIKEKLLRNLDKLCFDPDGYLANNEYLKTDKAEEKYQKTYNLPYQKDWKNRYLEIVVDGEEIDLENWDNSCPEYYEVKRELIKKIKSEIKQNPSEWKIERVEVLPGLKYDQQEWLIKHQSGLRHWKLGISNMRGKQEWRVEGKSDWPEIEALINGSELPNKNLKPSDTELEKVKSIFQKRHIKKITYEKGQLFIEYDNTVNSVEKAVNSQEIQELRKYCQEHNEKEISKERFSKNNTSLTSNPDKSNQKLAIGLALGAGAVLLVGGAFIYLRRKKIK